MVAALAVPVAGALGISTTAASVGLSLAGYAATTAASIFLQMSMAEEQKQEIGTKLSAVLGGAVNQSIHFGSKETAGSFIYKGTWGRSGKVPNAFLVRVYALSDRPVDGFEDYVWAGGLKCNFDAGETDTIDGVNLGHPIPKYNSSGGHRLWVKFHDGSQNVADGYLVDKFGGDANHPWTEDHIGRGRAYMIVTQKVDKKQSEGELDVVAVVKKSRYYDWRNDSTNGGSGSQRYGNYGTYGVDPGNPVVMIYNVMRGIYYGDEWLYGGQAWPATRFDNDTWTAAANKCDTDVGNKGGGSHKWARVGGEIDLSEEPWTIITRLLRACNGRIVESGGVFKIYVGGIGAPVFDFTDDDIIVSEELTARLFPMREEIANTINGTYVEPANAGEAKPYKPRTKLAYVNADGDVRKTTIDFEYVRENRQAQRMAMLALNDNRRFRTFVIAFWTGARKLEPGDVVTWTSERYGFTDKEFIVGDDPLRNDGIVILNLREADSADGDWVPDDDEDEFETGVFEYVEPPTQALTATVTAVPFTDDDGTDRRPAIRIEAALDDDFVDCRALRYQVRKRFGDQKIIHRGRSETFFDPDNEDYGDITFTSHAIATMKGKQVQVRHKIEPDSERETSWSDWVTVTLDDLGIDDADTSDDLLAAPTGLSVTKVQQKDEDGTIRTFLKLNCTAPGWAGEKAEFIYEIEVEDDDTYRVKSKSEKARFRVNRTGKLHTVRARAKSGVGRLSNWTSGVSITPSKKSADASAVTGVTITKVDGKNVITWNRITDPDNREVGIYRNTSNNFATATLRDTTKGTKYTDNRGNTKGQRYYYWVVPIDTSDNVGTGVPSSQVNEVETGIGTSDTDRMTLAAPTGISLTQANRDVDKDGTVDIALLTTFSGGVAGATGYEVEWVDSAGQTASARADTGKFWFMANTTRSYQARWRAYDWTNQPGTWSSYSGSVTPAAKSGAPANPSSIAAVAAPGGFSVTWTAPTEFDYFYSEVGVGPVGGVATILDTVTSNRAEIRWDTGSFSTYIWVRHFNTSGLASSWVRTSSAYTSGKIVTMDSVNLGTSGGGIDVGSVTFTLATVTFIADSNATGVTVNLGSTSWNNVAFVNNESQTFHSLVLGGGTISFSKSGGGTFRGAVLTTVSI